MKRTYILGDKWSNDFDYDGMLAMVDKALAGGMSREDMERLADSCEDVNYHEECRLVRKKADPNYPDRW